MSSTTTNFGLHKIDLTDAPPDITVLNQNWDKIDGLTAQDFGAAQESQHQWESYSTLAQISDTLTTDSTPFEVASAMKDYSVLSIVTSSTLSYSGGLIPLAENGVLTIKKTTIVRVTFEFVGETNGLYYAYLRSNESLFSGWKRVYTTKTPPTASEAGAVDKTGDTMTGNLIIKSESPTLQLVDSQIDNNQAFSEIRKNAGADVDYGTYISDASGGTKDMLVLARANELDQKLLLRVESEDGSTNTKYKVYGTHNSHSEISNYADLEDIGLTAGSETIESIATALPTYSRLIVTVGSTNNTSIYPNSYFGLLTVDKTANSRIVFTFTNNAGAQWIGVYAINSSGNTWTGWIEQYSTKNLTGVPKIATGSYTGAGTYGSSNKNSLTFDFVPKLVIVRPTITVGSSMKPTAVIWVEGALGTSHAMNGDLSSYGTNTQLVFSLSGNTLSWYTNNTQASAAPETQLNKSTMTYYYIAIG